MIDNEQEKIDEQIENIDNLHEIDEKDYDKIVSAFSAEGLELRKKRKDVRYRLYRVQKEKEGKFRSDADEDFVKHFEKDPNFGGWKWFGFNWDVRLDNPWVCIHREKSLQQEWDDVVQAKYPQLLPDGGIHYPDLKVKEAVVAEAKLQEEAKKNVEE